MLGYVPEIYPDELIYSWAGRYYSHNGYPGYRQALDDLLIGKNDRVHFEFSAPFNTDAIKALGSMYSYQELILQHTMFPYYARFEPLERRRKALAELIAGNSRVSSLMQFQSDKRARYMRFCPECSKEDRKDFGETYFHRLHQIRNIGICVKHQCNLIDTTIRLHQNSSPRLHVAEEVIPQESSTIKSDSKELEFAKYMTELFLSPVSFSSAVPIGEFLSSKLDGTRFRPISGLFIHIQDLTIQLNGFYHWLPKIQCHRLQKTFTGAYVDFTLISRMAFFLGIEIYSLNNPILPQQTQTEQLRDSIHKLQQQGKSFEKMSLILNTCPESISRVYHSKTRTHLISGGRKGVTKENWGKMDVDSLPKIKETINSITKGKDRPGRVTLRNVCKTMGWPDKRLDYLPICKAEVLKNIEPIEEFWAKEVIWAYNKVKEAARQRRIFWRDIRSLINIKRGQFDSTFPFLEKFTVKEVADEIKIL
jgi:hypothetical protein